MVVGVVVALLLAWVHAVGERRVEQRVDPVGAAEKAPAPVDRQEGDETMASIRKEILIDASPEEVWAAVRDWCGR